MLVRDKINEIARLLYARMGYKQRKRFKFEKSQHPQEIMCFDMASLAWEEITGDSPDLDSDLLEESYMEVEDGNMFNATITFENDDRVVLEFLQPLKLKIASAISTKIRHLNNYEGVEVDFIPENVEKEGFYIKVSQGFTKETVARECFKRLKEAGLDEESIQIPFSY